MLNKLAKPLEWPILQQYFEELDIRNEIKTFSVKASELSESAQMQIKEALADLDHGNISLEKIRFSFDFIHLYTHEKYLLYEPDYFYNRYRKITLRAPFYGECNYFDVQKVRNFCRTKESEALKSGLQAEVWKNRQAEELFGPSEDAGDFSGSGSSGWQFIALSNLIIDLFAKEKNLFLKRISPYDSIMLEGKIHQIAKPIRLKDELFKTAVQKYVSRMLAIDLPES